MRRAELCVGAPENACCGSLGRHKPAAPYRRYLAEQEEGRRLAFVAEWRGEFAGCVTLVWVSDYRPFADRQIPEICDLNVLPAHRRQGIGNALLDRAESAAAARSKVVGLGVGLYSDYGAAQRIYVRRRTDSALDTVTIRDLCATEIFGGPEPR